MQSEVAASGRCSPGGAPAAAAFAHEALLSREAGDSLEPVLGFVRDGTSQGEPVSVGVSTALSRPLTEALRDDPLVTFFDMTQLGRNPSRIISAMLDFAAAGNGRRVRYVSEPCWPGRSPAAAAEAARHEALVPLAMSAVPATVLCVYGAGLDEAAAACAGQTHPVLVSGGQALPSPAYAGLGVVPADCDPPLTPVPAASARLPYSDDLRPVRAQVTRCALEAGLPRGRAADLTLAASEIAANTLRHTDGPGVLHTWRERGEVVCQVDDSGVITDPLAGRRRPVRDACGQGLWVVNQVCDLVELRSGPAGTTVRMHLYL